MRATSRLRAAATAAATLIALVLAGTAGAAPEHRKHLPGSVPPWAKASAFKHQSKSRARVEFRVYLGWRHERALHKLTQAVSTPGSGQYGSFLSPKEFRSKFAPSAKDGATVRTWLHHQGFTVGKTPANRLYLPAAGTIGEAADAFGTSFGEYAVQHKTLRAPRQALTLPSSLPVDAVVGLDQSALLVQPLAGKHRAASAKGKHGAHGQAPPPAGFRVGKPCSKYWAEKTTAEYATTHDGTPIPGAYGRDTLPYAPCGYNPAQVQGAYGVSDAIASGNDGSGVTVAVIDAFASPTIVQDVRQYSRDQGLCVPGSSGCGTLSQRVPPGIYNKPPNPQMNPAGWYGEETLDVEAVHSMAPGADILYVGAPNNRNDLDAALNKVVDKHLADIVTNSYGFAGEALPPGYIKPYNDIFLQAIAEGIGVYFSSGDSGDETGGSGSYAQATPDWPASSPYVTAVGGTSLAVGKADNRLFETGWETGTSTLTDGAWTPEPPGDYLYGGGGGVSRLFAQPAYQEGVVPDSMATAQGHRSGPMRVVPDISALGDPNTGFLVGETQTFPDGTYFDYYRIGGTSLSSPLMAGMMALVQQRAGHPLGFMNPTIYANAGSSAFDDITGSDGEAVVRVDYVNGVNGDDGYTYKLRTLSYDEPLTIHAAPGYDDVTGVGSPGSSFLTSLSH
ncbi:MAG: S53 family peptidase [Streptosporangiales bacterium]